MKILFIYPVIGYRPTFNQGIGYLSAVLKANGHKTDLMFLTSMDFSKVKNKIESYKPDIVVFSCTYNHWKLTKDISKKIKESSDLPIFVGGAHTTLFPDAIQETDAIDGICRGEGEYALLELVNKIEGGKTYYDTRNFWFRDGSQIIRNELRPLIENLDDLPFPDRSIFPKETILVYPNFNFSRGCPFDCTYCCNHALRKIYSGLGNFIRHRGVKTAISEIAEVIETFNPDALHFDDDTFTKNSRWLDEFCTEYKKNFDLPFRCNTRAELFNEKTAKLLKHAGCDRIGIGIESGDERLRKEVLRRHATNKDIIRAFKIARSHGFGTWSFNMIGIPGETKEGVERTIRLNQIVRPDKLHLSIFYPYPGTELGDFCISRGHVVEKDSYNFFDDTVLNLPDFPPEDILECARNFHYNVYKTYSLKKAYLYLINSRFKFARSTYLTPDFLTNVRNIYKRIVDVKNRNN